MDSLKKFIEAKICNIKEFLDIQHSLLKLLHKKKLYIETPNYIVITKSIEDMKIEYNSIIDTISIGFNYEADLLEEYIVYTIKYEIDNKHSKLNGKMGLFTYDLHQFVNSLDSVLPKCDDYKFGSDEKSFIGLIDQKCIDLMELEIVKLDILQNRWSEILKEEKELIENVKLLEDYAVMWRKYKYIIEQSILDKELNVDSLIELEDDQN